MTILQRLRELRPGQTAYFDNVAAARDDEEAMAVVRRGAGFYGDCGKHDFAAGTAEEAALRLERWGYTTHAATR